MGFRVEGTDIGYLLVDFSKQENGWLGHFQGLVIEVWGEIGEEKEVQRCCV